MAEPLSIVVFFLTLIAVSLLVLFVTCFVISYVFISRGRRDADYERRRAERYRRKIKELKGDTK